MWNVEVDDRAAREIRTLAPDLKAVFLHAIEIVESHGPDALPAKFVRMVERGLWELRLRGRSGIARALYFTLPERRLIVISAFVKKSQKLPATELLKAKSRMKDWRQAEGA